MEEEQYVRASAGEELSELTHEPYAKAAVTHVQLAFPLRVPTQDIS